LAARIFRNYQQQKQQQQQQQQQQQEQQHRNRQTRGSLNKMTRMRTIRRRSAFSHDRQARNVIVWVGEHHARQLRQVLHHLGFDQTNAPHTEAAEKMIKILDSDQFRIPKNLRSLPKFPSIKSKVNMRQPPQPHVR